MSEFRGLNARRAYVRMLPYADAVAGDYVAAKRAYIRAMADKDRCAAQYMLSPLMAGVLVKPGSGTLDAIGFAAGYNDVKPTGPIHPGYVAELLFAAGMLRSFCRLVSENTLAREHINALDGVLTTAAFDAQQLMRITLANNAALNVLRELGL